ncbi:DoxX family protein [Agromyces sp. NPDC049794]|uniref:DoxX family protein n=1 Tax=unclassified Agromyces TaxID=2639701 RepID=UPI0033E0E86F
MEPLITLVIVTLILLALGALGVRILHPWPVALRGGLAAMFVLTGVAHFVGKRDDLIAMVPPFLPEPELLVTITGVLELAGAIGLLIPRTAPLAAGGLTLMLIAMFPANVHLALTGTDLGPMQELWPRTLLQVVFIAATITAAVTSVRSRRVPTSAGVPAGVTDAGSRVGA